MAVLICWHLVSCSSLSCEARFRCCIQKHYCVSCKIAFLVKKKKSMKDADRRQQSKLCCVVAVLAVPMHRADLMKLLCAKVHQPGKKDYYVPHAK